MLTTKDILERLKSLRIEKGLRQEYVATVLGVSRSTYVRKEQGAIPITTDEWVKLAATLEKELPYFFSRSFDSKKEMLILSLYRALTPEEQLDFSRVIDLFFKRFARTEIIQALDSLRR